MKGDFSKWGLSPADNFSGVLHQQGRVLLDQDWNAAQQIQTLWKETAGQDVIGAGLVAVPAAAPGGLQILGASASAAGVDITLAAGRAWVDGVLVRYDGAGPLRADYLQPPLQDPPFDPTTIAVGVRDAVVLEVWDEAISAFQMPLKLLEPALGGPDTTERVKTCMALKLYRLAADQDCGGLPLTDDFDAKGRLTVVPSPTVVVPGPCPVPDSGGYAGFEHYLYRVEIAPPLAGQARFKWSQFNGGLVGRGEYTAIDAVSGTVAITANNQMINQSGLDDFYLEALAFDPAYGHWRTVLTADATLSAGDELSLTNVDGTWPAAGTAFFRLWNGIAPVSAFPTGLPMPNELIDGIRLSFDAPASGLYSPGDFWTFPARAAGVAFDPSVWPSNSPPQGIRYHRAALGVVEWTGAPPVVLNAADIHDCRVPFLPLARIRGCCTVTVGDNRHTFGHFSSIQAAVDALPPSGGTVCVLAGIYDESVRISGRVDIKIHGCGPRTRIRAVNDAAGLPAPAFLIEDSHGITLEDIAIEAGPRSAVQIDNSRVVAVRRCLLQMRDLPTIWQAIYSRGDDVLIEENVIEVIAGRNVAGAPAGPIAAPPPSVPPPLVGQPGAPASPHTPPAPIEPGHMTRGGIHLAGGSDRVRVVRNIIRGGIHNGITLGSLVAIGGGDDDDTPDQPGADPCEPCRPGDLTEDDDDPNGVRFRSAGDLYDIEIVENRISDMGLNGIGVVRFFNLSTGGGMIVVHGLKIAENVITRCLRRDLAPLRAAMANLVGYGGISLAAVTDLRIIGNEIVNNGVRPLYPVCGVFALIVQGLQVDANRILNNGPRDAEPAGAAMPGVRGGVHVWMVLPIIETHAGAMLASSTTAAVNLAARTPERIGSTTAMIRDNVIVAPLGRALTCFALGPVVVARNRMVTQGTTARGLDLIAATVLIADLGISNEWTLGLLLMLVLVLIGKGRDDDNRYCILAKILGLVDWVSQPMGFWPPISRNWSTGKILVSENQVSLDLIDEPFGVLLSSLATLSLDDVGFTDNQLEISSTNVFTLAANVIGGGSVRVSDNRMAETWMRAFYSGLTVGIMNTTTDNQATHCILAAAPLPQLRVFRDNIFFVETFCPNACGDRQG